MGEAILVVISRPSTQDEIQKQVAAKFAAELPNLSEEEMTFLCGDGDCKTCPFSLTMDFWPVGIKHIITESHGDLVMEEHEKDFEELPGRVCWFDVIRAFRKQNLGGKQ